MQELAATLDLDRVAALDRFEQHLSDVDDLDLVLEFGARGAGGDAVGEHDATERAAGGDLLDLLRGGLQHAECLVDTVDVDALADLLLHPHAGTAGAAAHGPFAVSRHLGEGGS